MCVSLSPGGPEDASTGSGDSGVEGGPHNSESHDGTQNGFVPGVGVITEADDRIILRDVPIVTPNLDIVVPKLSLEVSLFTALWAVYMTSSTCMSVSSPPGVVTLSTTGHPRNAPPHHGAQWLWKELTVPDSGRAVASVWWKSDPTSSLKALLHPTKVCLVDVSLETVKIAIVCLTMCIYAFDANSCV